MTKERNNFFMDTAKGISKELTLQDAVSIAVGGGRVFLSKRLSPPLCTCNGRIFCGNELLFKSDINLMTYARNLEQVAYLYNVKLDLLQESSDHVLWTSEKPNCYDIGSQQFDSLRAAYDYFTPYKAAQARRWALDHGLARRNPKEWFEDLRSTIRWKWYDFKRAIEKWKELPWM